MADLETIQRTVQDNNEKISELCQGIATITQRCIDRGAKIDGHRRTLYGENGTGGVVAKQNTIMQKINNMNNNNEDRKDLAKKILMRVVSDLLIVGILALLYMWKTQK